MAPLITLYILAGCVAAAAVLFIVMIVISALRPPQLPEISMMPPRLERVIRAITPVPFATQAAGQPFAASIPRAMAAPAVAAPPMQRALAAPHVAAPPMPTYNVQAIAARVAATPMRVAPPTIAPSPAVPATASHSAVVTGSHASSRAVAPVSAAPVARGTRARSAPSRQRLDLDPSARATSWPVYPERRSRKLVRFLMSLLVIGVLAAGATIAYPALLDPLCDDYEWFGADAAHVVRQHARAAHAVFAQFIENLQNL